MLGNVQCSHITAILMPALPPVAVGSSSATESWAEDAQEISSLILVIRINNVNTYIINHYQVSMIDTQFTHRIHAELVGKTITSSISVLHVRGVKISTSTLCVKSLTSFFLYFEQ